MKYDKRLHEKSLSQITNDVLRKEGNALLHFATTQDDAIVEAIDLILRNAGPVIVSGVGKSGHIGQKIAATLRSLGKPAAFLHASEASHGDLGIIQKDSTVMILSNSGETTELSDLMLYCRAYNLPVISMTSNCESTLANFSDVTICYGKTQEACMNGLAPTTSTTLCLAIGDAIAVGVSFRLGIAPEDFRRWHPGGKLGARISLVSDVMRKGADMPLVNPDATIMESLLVMAEKSVGSVIICEGNDVLGIATDGDVRRNFEKPATSHIREIATASPVYISKDLTATEAAEHMSQRGITSCIVGTSGANVEGYLHIHDCIS
ncbi:KpsF/GutQ family sugar-phosphate isomerase [Shimia marina]|uniref:Arabinose 5-phosphate isomerase KdsD n=1 Tax=Shimia marina TaxID=321267 RepID=A0A0P1EPQ8_9RHOB|nr:KpsF/GutQ family sugar-phosphate isomerase [Shimia marina]CUH52137.1 Arabinose 5-phosphate isomerase KdsD [Shimia marina]SFE64719.1 arabinose-5-phosphate isomerase [Shimia marina]